MSGPVGNMPGDYATASAERRAARNAGQDGSFQMMRRESEGEVPNIEQFLHGDLAKQVLKVMLDDEAAKRLWSSGDHAVAAMLAVFIDGQFRQTEDGRPRVVGPDTMRVVTQAANELMLTASSKRRLGIILEDDDEDDGWAEQFAVDDGS